MHAPVLLLALAAVATALPTTSNLQARQSGPVLKDTTFNAISISGGVAGNAEQRALDVFSALDLKNLKNIDPADLKFLANVNKVANEAEVKAFNPAIAAATGAAKESLQAGKIANKVLKLTATKLQLEAKQAQGENVSAKLATELKKLNNNIATDKKSAGLATTNVAFDAVISGGGKKRRSLAEVLEVEGNKEVEKRQSGGNGDNTDSEGEGDLSDGGVSDGDLSDDE